MCGLNFGGAKGIGTHNEKGPKLSFGPQILLNFMKFLQNFMK